MICIYGRFELRHYLSVNRFKIFHVAVGRCYIYCLNEMYINIVLLEYKIFDIKNIDIQIRMIYSVFKT